MGKKTEVVGPKVLRIIAVNGVRNVSATHKMASVLGIEKGSNEALEVCAFFPTSQDKLIMLQVNLVYTFYFLRKRSGDEEDSEAAEGHNSLLMSEGSYICHGDTTAPPELAVSCAGK